MEIAITDSHTLKEIQDEFNGYYPSLKLEFFNAPVGESEKYLKKNMITDVRKSIGEIRHIHTSGHLNINSHQKVRTVEDDFAKYYGINAQVFRKMGKIWLKTTTSDELSLLELNNESARFEKEEAEINNERGKEADIDVE